MIKERLVRDAAYLSGSGNPLADESAKKNLIYNYIPWSKQGKKRSITQSRYGTAVKKSVTAERHGSTTAVAPVKADPHLIHA